ncbi:hypothetical protein JVT61DRAFT_12173 [Boletus reticuloceps]|uniref:Uncharacterized protein n=1 Tax=Boletus reticuloceps TaxID=495285 RepID=A0A8I2YEI4_9AGAM|nr:hypothetical protein JVT61DRAFT_12173 [Boletus reticuloceps]
MDCGLHAFDQLWSNISDTTVQTTGIHPTRPLMSCFGTDPKPSTTMPVAQRLGEAHTQLPQTLHNIYAMPQALGFGVPVPCPIPPSMPFSTITATALTHVLFQTPDVMSASSSSYSMLHSTIATSVPTMSDSNPPILPPISYSTTATSFVPPFETCLTSSVMSPSVLFPTMSSSNPPILPPFSYSTIATSFVPPFETGFMPGAITSIPALVIQLTIPTIQSLGQASSPLSLRPDHPETQ